MNGSVLDNIDINDLTLFFSSNEIVPPYKGSRGKYDVFSYLSVSPEIKTEEKYLFKNCRSGGNQSKRRFISPDYNFIQELNLYCPLHNRGP
jgi:hypothetical protein